jgi:methylphosphotriester-DNA--protein-cysteine methyltransferase
MTEFRNQQRVEILMELVEQHPQDTLLSLALKAGFGSYAQCHRIFKAKSDVIRQTGVDSDWPDY